MNQRCPLLDKPFETPDEAEKIPEICQQRCKELWDTAVTRMNYAARYEIYDSATQECTHNEGVRFSRDTIVALGNCSRLYITIDFCEICGSDYGKQVYKFTCPNG